MAQDAAQDRGALLDQRLQHVGPRRGYCFDRFRTLGARRWGRRCPGDLRARAAPAIGEPPFNDVESHEVSLLLTGRRRCFGSVACALMPTCFNVERGCRSRNVRAAANTTFFSSVRSPTVNTGMPCTRISIPSATPPGCTMVSTPPPGICPFQASETRTPTVVRIRSCLASQALRTEVSRLAAKYGRESFTRQAATTAIGKASHSRAMARFTALTTASSVAVTMFESIPTP